MEIHTATVNTGKFDLSKILAPRAKSLAKAEEKLIPSRNVQNEVTPKKHHISPSLELIQKNKLLSYSSSSSIQQENSTLKEAAKLAAFIIPKLSRYLKIDPLFIYPCDLKHCLVLERVQSSSDVALQASSSTDGIQAKKVYQVTCLPNTPETMEKYSSYYIILRTDPITKGSSGIVGWTVSYSPVTSRDKITEIVVSRKPKVSSPEAETASNS